MKVGEIREMKTAELHVELDGIRRHLFDLRVQAVTEKLGNPFLMTKARRDVARILTILRERGETGIEQRQHQLEASITRR